MSELSTSNAQRIGIWIIAVVLTLGTIGSFVIIILANDNQKADQAKLTELMGEYQSQIDEYQAQVDKQTAELSDRYYDTFSKYSSRVSDFDPAKVTELDTTDLVIGTGDAITKDSSFSAYYIGWNPKGKVFDQSIDGDSLQAPLSVTPGGVISGWAEGVDGMKVGGVRELSIPSELAYGQTGSGDDIPPNTPIKFVIMIIPTPEEIPYPEPSEELIKLYNSNQ